MKHKQHSQGKRPKSPKQASPRNSLMKNQDHPFQPQHNTNNRGEQEPYQSMKHKIAAAKHKLSDREVEMKHMQPHEASFGNSFPDDQITPPHRQTYNMNVPPLPLANMIPTQQNNSVPMQPPPFFPPQQPNPLNGPPQPMPFAPNPMNASPFAPNPMNMPPAMPAQSSLDPVMAAAGQNFFQQLGGFNAFYYNALDPSLAQKKNVPVAVPGSKHWPSLAGTILLIAAIIVMIVGIGKFLQTSSAIGIVCGGVAIYLVLTIFFSSIRAYIFNMKRLADYETLFNRLRQGRAYFMFFIECYHYKTTTHRTKKGGTSKSRKKVVTHTARQEFNPTRYEDDSGQPQALKVHTPYAFVKYLKRFYFTDPASEGRFIAAFNRFVSSNRRDTHQSYHYDFQIHGFQPQVGFSYTGEGQHSKVLFFVFTLLGLSYPYSMWFENNVSRFQVNILKRLSA